MAQILSNHHIVLVKLTLKNIDDLRNEIFPPEKNDVLCYLYLIWLSRNVHFNEKI